MTLPSALFFFNLILQKSHSPTNMMKLQQFHIMGPIQSSTLHKSVQAIPSQESTKSPIHSKSL